MLCLKRRVNEEILIGDNIRIVLIRASDGQATVGIEAPREMKILRLEVRNADERGKRGQ
jgi:carbon storage regulator